jgi:hypothetical protein
MLGHHMALMTGLPRTTGGLIFLSDGDLDEVPELMIQFHARFARVGVLETQHVGGSSMRLRQPPVKIFRGTD